MLRLCSTPEALKPSEPVALPGCSGSVPESPTRLVFSTLSDFDRDNDLFESTAVGIWVNLDDLGLGANGNRK